MTHLGWYCDQCVHSIVGMHFMYRNAFYEHNYNFVKLVSQYLSSSKKHHEIFHYLPIKETPQALFKYTFKESWLQYMSNDYSETAEMHDICDGLMFRKKYFFHSYPSALQSYFIAFEAVNPIGSARGKHTFIEVYFTLGNLWPTVHSRIYW